VRRAAAILLTLLMPGLGHIHLGWVARGLAIWGAAFTAFAVLLFVWANWLFVPLVPGVLLALGWVVAQGVLWRDIEQLPPDGPGRRAPAPAWVQAVVFASFGVIPVGATLQIVQAQFVGEICVEGASMFPALLAGDRVVFERRAFDLRPPEVGELVVAQVGQSAPTVVRVLAVAGQTVHLRDGQPVVDGHRRRRDRLHGVSVPRFSMAMAAQLDELDCYIEAVSGHEYVVSYQRTGSERLDPAPVRVREGEVFVAGDNRHASVSARLYGKVELAEVTGRPRFVWASYDLAGQRRAGRGGLAFR
jgi:signal peptidase I